MKPQKVLPKLIQDQRYLLCLVAEWGWLGRDRGKGASEKNEPSALSPIFRKYTLLMNSPNAQRLGGGRVMGSQTLGASVLMGPKIDSWVGDGSQPNKLRP